MKTYFKNKLVFCDFFIKKRFKMQINNNRNQINKLFFIKYII